MIETSTAQPGLFDLPASPQELANGTPKPRTTKNVSHQEKMTAKPISQPRRQPSPPRVALPEKQRQKQQVARATSGLVPAGDVRLTANIREEIHLKLKIVSAHRRTTIGELIEELVENHLDSPYGIKKRISKI